MFETSRRSPRRDDDERRMAATGDEQLPVGAQRARDLAVAADAGDDVLDRRPERRILHPQRVAVQVGQLVRRRPEAVLVDQLVAAGRLADGAVVERLGAGGDERADGEHDEREPAADRQPGPARAPAPDRGDGPHAATLCRRRRGVTRPVAGLDAVAGRTVGVAAREAAGGLRAGKTEQRTLNLFRASPGKGSASRWRFHPPLPLAFRLRPCGLPRTTLGCGFDLLPLRARCTREPMRSVPVRQDPCGAEVRKERKLPMRLLL